MAIDFNLLKKTPGIDQDLLQSVQSSPFQGTTTPATPTILSSNTGKKTNQTNLDSLANIENTITVQAGETLSGIAQREGVKTEDITGFRSGDPNLIFPGEQLTIRGTSPATASMIGAIDKDLQDGALSSTDVTALKDAEANLLEATSRANALKDKPVELDEAMKSIEDFRTQYEKELSDLFKERGVLREERERLATPGVKEIEIRKQLGDVRSQAEAFKLQTQQDKFREFEGQTLGFAGGRAAEIDVKASFRRQEFALEERNLLTELGLEQELREFESKSVDQQISDFESDFELRQKVEEKIQEFEADVLDKANAISDEAKDTLGTFMDALEGVAFEDLSSEAQSQVVKLAGTAGLPIDLVKAALKANKQRQIFDQNIKERQQARLEREDTGAGTIGERKAQAISEFSTAFVPGATLPSGIPVLDSDGFMTPEAWKAAITDAPAEGLTREEFIEEFGYLITTPDGKVSPKYGLTPIEIKLITGEL